MSSPISDRPVTPPLDSPPAGRLSLSDEGAIVGWIGALTVALWYFLLDTAAGIPLRTPSVLGQAVLFGSRNPQVQPVHFDAVIVYTAVHFATFLALGIALAALVRAARDSAVLRYALLQAFLVFEVFFYGFLSVWSARTRELFPLWTVLGANTLAALAMGFALWRFHPELRASLRETPLGAAPR
jgi:hypothetical protein